MQIKSLTGLKVLATAGIFCWHVFPQAGLPDIGARLCEVFFVLSGFLTAYTKHGVIATDIRSTCSYVWEKIVRFYPAYLTGFLLYLPVKLFGGGGLSRDDALSSVWYFLIQQSWMPSTVAFSWNGAAWFISSLLFCYFCAPLLQLTVEHADKRFGKAGGRTILFFVVALGRIFLGVCARAGYPISEHLFPPVRLLEFALAYIVGASFPDYKSKYIRSSFGRSFFAGTLLELVVAAGYAWLVFVLNPAISRSGFVLAALVFVAVISLEGGLLSRMLSARFLASLAAIELEFYLVHQGAIALTSLLVAAFCLGGRNVIAVVSLSMTLVIASSLRVWSMRRKRVNA